MIFCDLFFRTLYYVIAILIISVFEPVILCINMCKGSWVRSNLLRIVNNSMLYVTYFVSIFVPHLYSDSGVCLLFSSLHHAEGLLPADVVAAAVAVRPQELPHPAAASGRFAQPATAQHGHHRPHQVRVISDRAPSKYSTKIKVTS